MRASGVTFFSPLESTVTRERVAVKSAECAACVVAIEVDAYAGAIETERRRLSRSATSGKALTRKGYCPRRKKEWVMSPIESIEHSKPTFWFGAGAAAAAAAADVEALAAFAWALDDVDPLAGASSSTRAPAIARAFAPPTDRAR